MSDKGQISARSTTIIACVVGLLFILLGAGFTYFSYSFTRTATTTIGEVTHVVESRPNMGNMGSDRVYTPTISFIDEQGVPQSAQTPVHDNDYNFPIGTELSILYDPRNPSQIKLNKWFELWGFGALFFAVGFGIFAYIIFAWKQNQKPSA